MNIAPLQNALPQRGGPAKFIFGAVVVFVILGGFAFVWDCLRALESLQLEISGYDREVKLQEERLVNVLKGIPEKSAELEKALQSYQAASGGPGAERRAAFVELAASANRALLSGGAAGAASGDPLRRRLYDEIAGSINRRDVSMRKLTEAQNSYNELARSSRGKLGRTFSGSLPEQSL